MPEAGWNLGKKKKKNPRKFLLKSKELAFRRSPFDFGIRLISVCFLTWLTIPSS